MKTSCTFFAIALLFLSCGGGEKKGDQENNNLLKPEFSPDAGTTFNSVYEFKVHNQSTGDKTNFKMNLSHKVESVNDKEIVYVTRYNEVSLDATIKGVAVSISASNPDTTGSEAGIVAAPIFAFSGKEYRQTYSKSMNKTGEELIGTDSSMSASLGEGKAQLFVYFPEKELKAGDTWEHDLDLKSSNKMSAKTTYKLESFDEKEINLSLKGEISGGGESFGQEFTISGTLNGTIRVDRKTGRNMNSEINQKFTLLIMGKEVPMEYTIRHRVVE